MEIPVLDTSLRPAAPPAEFEAPVSHGDLSVLSGASVTMWLDPATIHGTDPAGDLRLSPDRPVIIGRAEGTDVPYLDPAYRPTRVMPGTGQSVLQCGGSGDDTFVSRGHFMLRASGQGILLVNGVPGRAGGIRAPVNGTQLLRPVKRPLAPGEEYLVEHGASAEIRLPNNTVLRIRAV